MAPLDPHAKSKVIKQNISAATKFEAAIPKLQISIECLYLLFFCFLLVLDISTHLALITADSVIRCSHHWPKVELVRQNTATNKATCWRRLSDSLQPRPGESLQPRRGGWLHGVRMPNQK